MDDAAAAARRMWALFEPVHVVTYFTAEGRGAFEAAGLRGFWRGYFAGRAAPLGRAGAAPVVASFFVFAPAMVSRAIPAVWDLTAPASVLPARQAGAAAAIGRLLGLPPARPVPVEVRAAADGLMAAATGLEQAGRPLAAGNIALPVPDEPLARLWHAATLLREHRGDGHVAALVAADLDGAEALLLRIGTERAAPGAHRRELGARAAAARARLDRRGVGRRRRPAVGAARRPAHSRAGGAAGAGQPRVRPRHAVPEPGRRAVARASARLTPPPRPGACE
jgi:hypothetical protein